MPSLKPKSFHLQWHITERCNLSCRHCYQDNVSMKKELKTEELTKILKDFIRQIGIWGLPKEAVRISLTGGEPFVRKDFFQLLQKCYRDRDKFSYGILSNGMFINEETVRKLKKLEVDYVQVSIEGMEKVNDSIRGRGTFKKIIEAVKTLKKENIETSLSMTISKVNLKDVPQVISLAKDLGTPLYIRRLTPLGRGKMMGMFNLTPNDVRMLWSRLLKAREVFWPQIGLGCEDGMLTQDFPWYRAGDCSAGYLSFTILANGDVWPCRRLPIFAGNLIKEPFGIIYNSKSFRELRNLRNINDVCSLCPTYKKCHGGAKCMAFSYFQDASAPDPHCWRLFEKLAEPGLRWRNSGKKLEEKLNFEWLKP